MEDTRTTNDYGQAVRTWTVPSGHVIVATTSNRRDGLDHKGAGEVEVYAFGGGLKILKFDHTWAEGAGHELAISLANAYGQGQQSAKEATA